MTTSCPACQGSPDPCLLCEPELFGARRIGLLARVARILQDAPDGHLPAVESQIGATEEILGFMDGTEKPAAGSPMAFEQLLDDVADAAREGAGYELPAADLLVWLEELQEYHDTEDRLGRELGYEPGEQPALSDLVAMARQRAGQGLRPNAVVLDGSGRAYRLVPEVKP